MNVINFFVPNVVEYLRKHGEVYTLRSKRPVGIADVYVNRKLVGIALVRFVKEIRSPDDLKEFVDKSGFSDPKAWFDVAKTLHDKAYRRFGRLYLYHVKIIRWLDTSIIEMFKYHICRQYNR